LLGVNLQLNELFGNKKIGTKPVFMLQNMSRQTCDDFSKGHSMQFATWLQQRVGWRSNKQAWGLAPAHQGWCLLGLGQEASRLIGVHTVQFLSGELEDEDQLGVSYGLRQSGAIRGALQGRHRVNMGLALDQVVGGVLAIPGGLASSDCEAEVQLEAARTLDLEPQDISFDWEMTPLPAGVVEQQLRWVACTKGSIDRFNQCVRRAGWQLASVEPVVQAAQRAAACLCGGLSVLLTRPVQDWQFDLALLPDTEALDTAVLSPLTLNQALQEALQSPAGPRLVAAGLALKAWT
jgi:hypothetical protein